MNLPAVLWSSGPAWVNVQTSGTNCHKTKWHSPAQLFGTLPPPEYPVLPAKPHFFSPNDFCFQIFQWFPLHHGIPLWTTQDSSRVVEARSVGLPLGFPATEASAFRCNAASRRPLRSEPRAEQRRGGRPGMEKLHSAGREHQGKPKTKAPMPFDSHRAIG